MSRRISRWMAAMASTYCRRVMPFSALSRLLTPLAARAAAGRAVPGTLDLRLSAMLSS